MTDPITQSMIQGAAGASGDPIYVDDVFAIDRYKGNGSIRSITNGLDLSGEGGMVWIKSTNLGSDWVVGSTGLNDDQSLCLNTAGTTQTAATKFRTLDSNGFTVGSDHETNNGSYDYLSFSFRKQPKFLDIVTYTGNGTGRQIAHELGSVPGVVLIKNLTASQNWAMYHRGMALTSTSALLIDDSGGLTTSANYWNSTVPTASHFSVGGDNMVNGNGNSYIAYIFAHDAGGFGEAGDENVISCGEYTGNGSNLDVNIGFEPQWWLVKNADATASWCVVNTTYGYGKFRPSVGSPSDALTLATNANSAMSTSNARISQIPNGIRIMAESQAFLNESGRKYVYIAIRSSVGLVSKLPAAGIDVFSTGTANSADCPPGSWPKGFEVDFTLHKNRSSSDNWEAATRKSGEYRWFPNTTSGQPSSSNGYKWDSSTGMGEGISGSNSLWGWKRSRGFDVQCTYAGGAGTYNHNLGQVPEMIWVGLLNRNDWRGVGHHKLRGTDPWNYVAYMNNDSIGNAGAGYFNNTAPTTTQFTLGNNEAMSYYTIMVCLWCSVEGICKIDDYTGDGGSSNAINCGFQPRYVMIKRVDSAGDWKVWDFDRGTNRLSLNSSNAQVNDVLVSFTSTGFTLVSPDGTTNANGGRYIYHAQA